MTQPITKKYILFQLIQSGFNVEKACTQTMKELKTDDNLTYLKVLTMLREQDKELKGFRRKFDTLIRGL